MQLFVHVELRDNRRLAAPKLTDAFVLEPRSIYFNLFIQQIFSRRSPLSVLIPYRKITASVVFFSRSNKSVKKLTSLKIITSSSKTPNIVLRELVIKVSDRSWTTNCWMLGSSQSAGPHRRFRGLPIHDTCAFFFINPQWRRFCFAFVVLSVCPHDKWRMFGRNLSILLEGRDIVWHNSFLDFDRSPWLLGDFLPFRPTVRILWNQLPSGGLWSIGVS